MFLSECIPLKGTKGSDIDITIITGAQLEELGTAVVGTA
jgi:hypothetical protein